MSDEKPTVPDEEVEAHMLKEALATGAAAATMLAGAGIAQGGTAPSGIRYTAGPTQVLPEPGGGPAVKLPEPGGSGSTVIPVPDVGSKARVAPKKPTAKKHHKITRHKKN